MKIGLIGTAALAAMVVVGCGKKDAAADGDKAAAKPAVASVDPKKVAVQVNDAKLSYGELDADIAKIVEAQKIPAEQLEEATKHFREQLAQQFVMKSLLLGEAGQASRHSGQD